MATPGTFAGGRCAFAAWSYSVSERSDKNRRVCETVP